jgi:hypothetical protein
VCDAVAKWAEVECRETNLPKGSFVNDSAGVVTVILEKLTVRSAERLASSPKITAGDNERSEHHCWNGNLDTVWQTNSSASLGAQRTIK